MDNPSVPDPVPSYILEPAIETDLPPAYVYASTLDTPVIEEGLSVDEIITRTKRRHRRNNIFITLVVVVLLAVGLGGGYVVYQNRSNEFDLKPHKCASDAVVKPAVTQLPEPTSQPKVSAPTQAKPSKKRKTSFDREFERIDRERKERHKKIAEDWEKQKKIDTEKSKLEHEAREEKYEQEVAEREEHSRQFRLKLETEKELDRLNSIKEAEELAKREEIMKIDEKNMKRLLKELDRRTAEESDRKMKEMTEKRRTECDRILKELREKQERDRSWLHKLIYK